MVLSLLLFLQKVSSLSCLDSSGNAIDYWTILKAPENANGAFGSKTYFYLNPNQPNFVQSTSALNQSSPMTSTLNQLNINPDISYITYNDCVPPECSSNYNYSEAHSKGVLAWTDTEAFAIFHSIAAFPYIIAGGKVVLDLFNPEAQTGQHLFCVTLAPQDLWNLAGILSISLPNVYHTNVEVPNSNISMLITNQALSNAKSLTYAFQTLGGLSLNYLVKSASFNADFYESVVSPAYNDGLLIQSWGRPYEKDFCPPSYPFKNVNIDEIYAGNLYWASYFDNSKWAVGITSNLVCYGDLNRMYSQWNRGGSAVCALDQGLKQAHFKIIQKYDSC